MVFYAQTPARRTRQIVVDLIFLAWMVVALVVAGHVHSAVAGVADQTRKIDTAGSSLAGGLSDAGDYLDGTPLVGDEVAKPFDAAASSSDDVAQAGADAADQIDRVATLLALATFLVLVLLAAPYYLPGRVRFIMAATAMQRLASRPSRRDASGESDPGDTADGGAAGEEPIPEEIDLLALRALVRRSVSELRDVELPATGWRAGDRTTIAALANLELKDQGLAPRF